MRLLVLGGTQWLGRLVAEQALAAGHEVTCLARGSSGPPPTGARFVAADRDGGRSAYDDLRGEWDGVLDLTRQPGQARAAAAVLAPSAGSYCLVSTCSVYADADVPGQDETAPLLPALAEDVATLETYGEGKVACEEAVRAAGGERAWVVRPGLIAGPGDVSDRTGYWPLRFAHPATTDGAVLVPDSPGARAQVVDARDLAAWLVGGLQRGVAGTMNAVGPSLPLAEHLAVAREVAGHAGETVGVSQEWLLEHRVEPWMGERSLPLWLPSPEYDGFATRSAAAAVDEGLQCRPLADTLADTLDWELRHGPGRVRRAGLSPADEVALIAAARSGG